jgi:hypothetical protein
MSVDKRLTAEEKKKIKPVKQAGATNYLGKQEMVTAPKFWLSEPDHVKAKLAYITDEEEKILIDKNLYGSLKGKPNKGPAGLPSLQGGDFGSEDQGTNEDGSDNPGYDVQADLTNYATNVGKTAKSTGGFKGDGFFGGVVDTVKDYVTGGGLIGLAARGLNKAFGPKSFEDTYGYATDYQGSPGPSQVNENDNRGGDDGRDLYAATNQYTAPTPIEEEGITTVVNDPNFIQRFMVKEPYRQAKGLDFLAQNQAIANMINNLYT